jgi:hypothetical protein
VVRLTEGYEVRETRVLISVGEASGTVEQCSRREDGGKQMVKARKRAVVLKGMRVAYTWHQQ